MGKTTRRVLISSSLGAGSPAVLVRNWKSNSCSRTKHDGFMRIGDVLFKIMYAYVCSYECVHTYSHVYIHMHLRMCHTKQMWRLNCALAYSQGFLESMSDQFAYAWNGICQIQDRQNQPAQAQLDTTLKESLNERRTV